MNPYSWFGYKMIEDCIPKPKYSAKNKKGKDSKNWETKYKDIWAGKKR